MAAKQKPLEAPDMSFKTALKRGAYVELSLACKDVPRLDVTSKSDPFCVVYTLIEGETGEKPEDWRRAGQTETVFDSHMATWTQKFPAGATDTTVFKFDCYDRDSPRETLGDHDFIGTSERVALTDILNADGKSITFPLRRPGERLSLRGGKSYGTLQVSADAIVVETPNVPIQIQVACDSTERSKFYYQLSRKMPHGSYHPVYRSELLEKKKSYFDTITMKLSSLCASDLSRPMMLQLFKFYPMGRSALVGFAEFTFDCLADRNSLEWTKTKSGDPAKVSIASPSIPGAPDSRLYRFEIRFR